MKTRTLVVFALVVAVLGCAGSKYDIASKHDALRDYQGGDAGFLVAGAGSDKSTFFSYSGMTFRRRNTENLGDIGYAPKSLFVSTPTDFESSTQIGTVHVKRLPPGEYEVFSAYGVQTGTYEQTYKKPIAPPILFTIKTGEVSYLGRFSIGSSRSRGPVVTISDNVEADVATARTRLPALPTGVVRSFTSSQRIY